MRIAGSTWAALLVTSAVALAQPVAPAAPPAVKTADPKLDAHLAAWEKKTTDVKNLWTEVALKRTDAVFKKDTNYTGSALCMKPTLARLRLDNAGDTTKTDYEAYICDGKAVYAYDGIKKTITKIGLPQNRVGTDNLMLDFLAGMKAKDAKARFDIALAGTDEHYIYLDIKPLRPADQREFTHLRFALYGTGPKTAALAYLPAQVNVYKPNGDKEEWRFTAPKVDVPEVKVANFAFERIEGWEVKEVPPPPMGGAAPRPGKP